MPKRSLTHTRNRRRPGTHDTLLLAALLVTLPVTTARAQELVLGAATLEPARSEPTLEAESLQLHLEPQLPIETAATQPRGERSAFEPETTLTPTVRVDGDARQRTRYWPWLSVTALTAFVAGGALWTLRAHDSQLLDGHTLRIAEAQRLRDRAPWLTGGGIALGALGAASLFAAVLDLMTVRSTRDSTAWTLRMSGPQLTLKRRF